MNRRIVCRVLTWVMILPNVFCQTDKCNCISWLRVGTDTANSIVYGLLAYSSVTTVLLVWVCCLCCRRSKVKPDEGRHRQHSWHSEENEWDYGRAETISLDQTTEIESKVTSIPADHFSKGSPKIRLPFATITVPIPTVPEDYGKFTDTEERQVPEQDQAGGTPPVHDVQEESEQDIKANSTSSPLEGNETMLENQKFEDGTYENASMMKEDECVTKESKSCVYEIPDLESEPRHNSIDSTNYERISFIRRSSSVHDYQYVDNKHTTNALDVVPELEPAVTLSSIEEETEQQESDMHYAGLKDDTRSPSGSVYESLETEQENEGECVAKQEPNEKGFYQCLAAIPAGKYTKLTKETQDELSATMRRQKTDSHAEDSQVPVSNDEYNEKRDSCEYAYPPDYLVLVHNEPDNERSKHKAPMRYVNAEKSPNFMACVAELKKNSSTC